jgi:hypothetical protein
MPPNASRRRPSNRSGTGHNHLHTKKAHIFRVDWKPLVSALERNEPYLLRAVGQGRAIFRMFMWKHHFSPIDTSNVVAWLNTPANLLPPARPVINGIPREILARIFAFVVHSDCTTPKDRYAKEISYSAVSSGTSPTTPVILGHVCSFWRSFVRATPSLWSTIAVYSPRPGHAELVAFWLDRSANCPLDLRMEQFVLPDPASAAVAALFVAQARRWKRISLTVSIEAPFTTLGRGAAPILEDVRVRLDKWNPATAHSFIHVLQASPVLHTINWGKSICARIPADTPWHRLSNIALQSLELSKIIMGGLAQCGALEVLHLRHMRKAKTHNLTIVLPRVERFVCESTGSHPRIFDAFTLPSLSDLHWLTRPGTEAPISSVINMLDRSGCALKTLAVNRGTFDLVSARIVADVTTLRVFDAVGESSLLKLSRRPGQCVMPTLRHLLLETCIADDGMLSTVLVSRFPQLKTVQVCLDRRSHPKDTLTLGWLRRDGMTVDIQEPFLQTRVVTYTRLPVEDSDPDSDTVPTLRFPDVDTLWT